MKAKTQLRKPENWQDFESLCKKLWGEIWNCPDTIKKHGRSGQNQHGVDICAIPNGKSAYYGIQCKGKDEYTNSQLTIKEIDNEINKAKSFIPTLGAFYFATTANKDAAIEGYIRQKNIESLGAGSFSIEVFFWEDIVDLIENHRNTYNWYVNDMLYSDAYQISIDIRSKNKETPYILFPKFTRKITRYQLREPKPYPLLADFDAQLANITPFHFGMPTTYNYQWCTITLYITNNGSLPIEQYTIDVTFENGSIVEIDSLSGGSPSWLLPDAMKAEIIRQARESQEVFLYRDDRNSLQIEAKKNLVQKKSDNFSFAVKPIFEAKALNIHWVLTALNFNTEGHCRLEVNPIIEDEIKTIWVNSIEDVLPDEIEIVPKEVTK